MGILRPEPDQVKIFLSYGKILFPLCLRGKKGNAGQCLSLYSYSYQVCIRVESGS